ncbi:efflux RND transporter periplasmic adaptor subunit [Motiliproteus sediminis]|uniref:efflux RND transporter periplasmic adaptor subunit n=1 Tax=Motiliproteus sediminis TaxID=1468178 RepID=UPI001AEF69E4|nr:efflux RND transporter periplasmic adaptor subunit [Motiliproteus sediminis]
MTRILSGIGLLLSTMQAFAAGPTPVEVTEIRYEALSKEVRSSGRVEPVAELPLAFNSAGLIDRVAVEAGEVVAKGQLIARLDLERLDAMLARARTLEADARRQVQRIQQLRHKQLASDEQLQLAQTAFDVARADLRVASFNRRHAELRAPANGRILERLAEAQQVVPAGQPVVRFADANQGWVVKLRVADVDVVRLSVGDPATIRMDAYPDQLFDGRVRTIAGKADPASLTFEVEVELVQPPRLHSGLIAHATLRPRATTRLAQLPLTALVRARGQDAEIFLLDQHDRARKADVRIAWIAGNDVLIYPGPEASSRVVTRGGSLLFQGAEVRTLP